MTKEMKILYFAVGVDIDNRNSNGVFKKITGQSEGLKRLGHSCEIMLIYRQRLYCLTGDGSEYEDNFSEKRFKELFSSAKYDLVYARNGVSNREFNQCIKVINQFRCKCIVEIPTYPILWEQIGKARDRFQNHQYVLALRSFVAGVYLQNILLPKLGRKINRFAVVSSDVKIGRTECVCIENGIDVSAITPIDYSYRAPHPLTMIAVANINYWHGFDRVISGIAEYVELTGNRDIRLIVVGDGDYLQRLKYMAEKNNISDIVHFVGRLSGKELSHAFSEADVAIGSLGLHRKKLKQSSTLKSREYCARGIPFVISAGEERPHELKDYIYEVEANDNPVDVSSIIDWYEMISPNIGKHSQIMREYAEKNFQWQKQMEKALKGLV